MDLQLVRREDTPPIALSGVLAGLSLSLDLADGQRFGHSLRTCLIGMGLARRLRLSLHEERDLYFALLVQNLGCTADAARLHALMGGDDRVTKRGLRRTDWTRLPDAMRFAWRHAHPRASFLARAGRLLALAGDAPVVVRELAEARGSRAAEMARRLGLGDGVAATLATLDEHWDGGGQPRGLRGSVIPMPARIVAVARAAEEFTVLEGVSGALAMARLRSGRWFDPEVVEALGDLVRELERWAGFGEHELHTVACDSEPGDAVLVASEARLDQVAGTFALLVDAKSRYTQGHSTGVADLAVRTGRELGLEPRAIVELRRAALLHDLGKVAVPNAILDKQGPLTVEEWETVRLHPHYTHRILERTPGYDRLAFVASAHHERLDGRGYFRGLHGDDIPLTARILAVADGFEALTSDRPFRPALPEDVALKLLERDRGIGIDGDCLTALLESLGYGELRRSGSTSARAA